MRKVKGRKGEQANGRRISFAHSLFLPLTLSIFLFTGCTENTQPTTQPASWTDQAESDPANFNPKMTDPNISGGSIGNFDKPAFDKDLNDVLNP